MQADKINEVTVTVDANEQITCTPDQLTVTGSDAVLRFTLQSSGYTFPTSAAVVVDNPGTQFPFPSRTLAKTPPQATLYDHCSEANSFKYTVTVQRVSDGGLISFDPMIINEP